MPYHILYLHFLNTTIKVEDRDAGIDILFCLLMKKMIIFAFS